MPLAFHGNPLILWLLWQLQGPTDLQWENACHQWHFGFDQIFLKLADKVDMDESENKFETG